MIETIVGWAILLAIGLVAYVVLRASWGKPPTPRFRELPDDLAEELPAGAHYDLEQPGVIRVPIEGIVMHGLTADVATVHETAIRARGWKAVEADVRRWADPL